MRFLTLFLLILLLAGCAEASPAGPADQPPAAASPAASMTLTSPAFGDGQPIPALYSCQGKDISPALEWSAPPAGAQSLALLVDDPDAPGGTWTHWIVYNLPVDARGLAEGASSASGDAQLPQGALQGKNSFRRVPYGGPCPPSGTHRYYFKLYALDTTLSGELDRAGLLKAIEGHVLAQAEIMGTYAK